MIEGEKRRLARLRPNLLRRALIYEHIRAFFKERDFLEVETPVRVPAVAPEPYITPFNCEGWFLSTSPELHMKRMLAAGYERLFQFSRCFRKGERGRWHNPEFTMLEWYRTGAGYNDIIQDIEQMVTALSLKLGFKNTIKYRGQDIDLSLPWPRITVRNAFLHSAGWDPVAEYAPLRFDTDFVTKVLPGFAPHRPTVLVDYPAPQASLARLKPDDAGVAERAEVFIGGLELANAYGELVDAREQERRFREAIEQIRRERQQQFAMPRSFIEAVSHLPECGGVALGIDRLVMLLCDADSIDDVMPFTADTA
ncbi:MAG TPA: EF-P lysine aminoacylase EpmA [Dehalococcoidales bacterium]|nr:EF-P lysine aminoacylase EpmA [Dehalococcoidales bacterium]